MEGERPRSIPRPLKLILLGAGLVIALYFGSKAPRDQHLRLVLGDRASDVTAVSLQYLPDPGEEVARETRMTFPEGAPRVVAHDPALTDGDYRVRIDLDTRQGRRAVERRVRLGGGSTQIDLASDLARPTPPLPSSSGPR